MQIHEKIQEAYKTASNYPDLVRKLFGAGVLSYTVNVPTSTILYRFDKGENIMHPGMSDTRVIAATFDEQQTIQAIRNNQQGRTDYPGFMNEIAAAGVQFYEATLNGPRKRVTYIGRGGFYEEAIPV